MSKGKAKIASKNNPEGRGQAKEYFHNGKKIKPVKLVLGRRSYFAAEYEESGDLCPKTRIIKPLNLPARRL